GRVRRVRGGRAPGAGQPAAGRAGPGPGRLRRGADHPGPLPRVAGAVRGGDRHRRPDRRPGRGGGAPPGPGGGAARGALGGGLAFLGAREGGVGELAEAHRIVEAVGTVDQVARTFATWSGLLETFGGLEAAAGLALEGAEGAGRPGPGRWPRP